MVDKSKPNLWGGRFEGDADPDFAVFNSSFSFDRRLLDVDIRASIAYCDGLAGAGVLTASESEQIKSALHAILDKSRTEAGYLAQSAEDVHSFVEARLIELVGDVGRKLHTGRSRNDQVATDMRLWVREEIERIELRFARLRKLSSISLTEISTRSSPATLSERAQPSSLRIGACLLRDACARPRTVW